MKIEKARHVTSWKADFERLGAVLINRKILDGTLGQNGKELA